MTKINQKLSKREFSMELVYLWVEDYKNIKRQGFNFSPNFEVEFTPVYNDEKLSEKSELKITPKENPLKDFFAKNINVTAIVGGNGSGKTNTIEAIISILDTIENTKKYEREKLFLVYFFDNKYFVKSININLEKINNQTIENLDLENNKCFSIYFNYTLDVLQNQKTKFDNLYHRKDNYKTPITMLPNKKGKKIDIDNMEYHTQNAIIDFAIRNNIDFSEIKEYFIPSKIRISLDKQKIIIEKETSKVVEFYDRIYQNIENKEYFEEVKNYIDDAFNEIDTTSIFRVQGLKNDISKYLREKNLLLNKINEYTIVEWKDITKLYLISKLELLDRTDKDSKIELLIDNDKKFIEKIEEKGNIENQKANIAYEFFKKIYDKNKLPFKFDENYKINIKENKDFVELLPSFMRVEIFNEQDVSFESLSFGQKFMMRFSYNLIYQLNNIKEIKQVDNSQKYTNINLLLDEIELGLHPNWQKNFVNFLIKVLSKFKDYFNFNIIITSHSPFILSDLPKENVIFLEKDDQTGNCINATKKMKDFNTFGANIHTLLSNGFFMKDGLMGEFAKNKISKILNFLNGKNKFIDFPINQIKPTLELIGEDFLREKLLKMYNEKLGIKSKDDEINELKAEIERLKNAQNKI